MFLLLVAHPNIMESRKNLFFNKHSKTGIILQMPTVHSVLLKTMHSELL